MPHNCWDNHLFFLDFSPKICLYADLMLDINEGKKMLVRLGRLSRRGLSQRSAQHCCCLLSGFE